MRFDAALDVGEALAMAAAAGGAEAGEVVLVGADVAGVAQGAGLEDHLEEGDVPADAELLAEAHVLGGKSVEAVVDARIARAQVRHEASRGGAGGHLVGGGDLDLGKIGRDGGSDGWRRQERSQAMLRKISS